MMGAKWYNCLSLRLLCRWFHFVVLQAHNLSAHVLLSVGDHASVLYLINRLANVLLTLCQLTAKFNFNLCNKVFVT